MDGRCEWRSVAHPLKNVGGGVLTARGTNFDGCPDYSCQWPVVRCTDRPGSERGTGRSYPAGLSPDPSLSGTEVALCYVDLPHVDPLWRRRGYDLGNPLTTSNVAHENPRIRFLGVPGGIFLKILCGKIHDFLKFISTSHKCFEKDLVFDRGRDVD